MTLVPATSAALSACSAATAPSFPSSSNVPASILGRFRCDFGPKVSENGSASTICGRFDKKGKLQELEDKMVYLTLRK
jgi:hypothetical protein